MEALGREGVSVEELVVVCGPFVLQKLPSLRWLAAVGYVVRREGRVVYLDLLLLGRR